MGVSPIPVLGRFKAQVCDRLISGIVDSNPAEGTDVRPLLAVFCVGRDRPLRRADPSFRGALPCVCVCLCHLETSTMWRPRPELGCCAKQLKKSVEITFGGQRGSMWSWGCTACWQPCSNRTQEMPFTPTKSHTCTSTSWPLGNVLDG